MAIISQEVLELLEKVRLAVVAGDLTQAEAFMIRVRTLVYPTGRR